MRTLIYSFRVHLCLATFAVLFDRKVLGFLIALIGMMVAMSANANSDLSGKVIAVIDGNTIEIFGSGDEVHKVVLADIDCPELGQEFGDEAKMFLKKILLGRTVSVEVKGKDRSGNYLGVVMIDGKRDPRVALLKEGLAWLSETGPSPDLETYKTGAQRKGKGLWKQENPTPPWTYRRNQTMLSPKGR